MTNLIHDLELQLRVMASDGREPPRTANNTITVSITRDESTPQFMGTPYNNARVSENTEVGREFFTRVRATDQDLQGSIRYEVTGDMPAPNYFEVSEETGAISVKADLKTDDEMEYKVN